MLAVERAADWASLVSADRAAAAVASFDVGMSFLQVKVACPILIKLVQ